MKCGGLRSPDWFAKRELHRQSLLRERRACTGLVPSINNVNTFNAKLDGFEVDKLESRCVRLRKNLGIAAKWLSQDGCQAWMLTFTYKDGVAWEPSHMRESLNRLRVWLKRAHNARLRYVWVMETKARKTGLEVGQVKPHYHVVVWMPRGVSIDDLKMDERGYWTHGLTNVVKAKAAVRYVMKYASKFDNEGAFPRGARCYGIGGLDDVGRRVRRWVNWPSFVQARASVADDFRRRVGGGWIDASSGEWWPSEFGLVYSTRQKTAVVRLHNHGRPIDASGPFNWVNQSSPLRAEVPQ